MTNFLYLPGWEVPKVQSTDMEYIADASYSKEPDACIKCGVIGELYRHGKKLTAITDAPVHGKQVTLRTSLRRYKCRACGQTFVQPIKDLDGTRRMTVRCVEYIRRQCLLRPFTQIAEDIGIDEKTVRQIANDHIAELNARYRIEAPRVLGIDEVVMMRRPRAIFVDIEKRLPLDLLPDRNRPLIDAWLQRLRHRERVEVVSIDMWRPYRDAARLILPQAVVVADKFHVIRMANDAVEKIRKEAQKDLSDKARKSYKRSRHLLLKRPDNLSDKQALALDGWLKNDPAVEAAYNAKEAFYGIYSHETRADAEEAYKAWLASLDADLKRAFKPLITAMKNWHEEVFAFFDTRVTNAFTEATNSVLRVANRAGRGYSFEVIRARVLFRHERPGLARRECEICKAVFFEGDLEVSHIKPLHMLTEADELTNNIQRVCPDCHRFHTHSWFEPVGHSTPKSE